MLTRKMLLSAAAVAGLAVAACDSAVSGDGDGGAAAGGGTPTAGTTGSGTPTGGSGGSSANDCRDTADCAGLEPSWLECVPPGGSLGCGTCWDGMDPCDTDAECEASLGEEYVCGPPEGVDCACGMYSGNCTLACTGPADCLATEECDPEGHCIAKVCAQDSDCGDSAQRCPPSLLECVVAQCAGDDGCDPEFECDSTYQCVRRSCATDADCPDFCVVGHCYDSLGTCEEGPA